ncbi:hypothetical protein F1C10_08275 [Sphingomonas sp. NBWT7]|uniref:hypothetical protein n=1 Tax=Sphingomonas sp. NBWT7 TaxID=2596913 RepID=UPI0016264785|nr:hypothetical protein [Sphingomonas sp. NBWT7]QNE31931.1 hypothetical protein F1C10_08275 [Sphingomonas sp. NBWT7]
MSIFFAGLLLGTPMIDHHRVEIDHGGHRVEVTYRSDAALAHRQIGAAGAPGRPATLRCAWTAKLTVEREARSSAGHVLKRAIASETPISGTRPGWCDTQRGAIAQEVAMRSSEMREHLLAVAAEDRGALALELDRVHAPACG